ncbi:hypothetical protein HPB52_001705 [Rhipicephalus sanguineus]|uniref:Uncharacterized protein n=1 Tax=Rhipicephalus sanguineus TaxID=34632 RepID=A0A9D4PTR3_RHISA|nr:hypothetical protein HPB52_001705 [Rhipicephalus sanguineus]
MSSSLETQPSGKRQDQVIVAEHIVITLQQRQYMRQHRVWLASPDKLQKLYQSQRVNQAMLQINLFKCDY